MRKGTPARSASTISLSSLGVVELGSAGVGFGAIRGKLALKPREHRRKTSAAERSENHTSRWQFDRHRTVEGQIGRPVDNPHPAPADQAIDSITSQHLPDDGIVTPCHVTEAITRGQSGSRGGAVVRQV
jgi:hypothetical protein